MDQECDQDHIVYTFSQIMVENVARNVVNSWSHAFPRQDLGRSRDGLRQFQDTCSERWITSAQLNRIETVRAPDIEQTLSILGQSHTPCKLLGWNRSNVAHGPLIAPPLLPTHRSVHISCDSVL